MANFFMRDVSQPVLVQQAHSPPQTQLIAPLPQVSGQFDASHCNSLYVGNLPASVTETLLYQLFSSVGAVIGVKLKRDKTVCNGAKLCSNASQTLASCGYGFIDMVDHQAAANALVALNGHKLFDKV